MQEHEDKPMQQNKVWKLLNYMVAEEVGGGGLEMTIDLISALHLKQNIEYSVKYFMLFYCEHSVLFILSVQLKL